MLRRLLFLFLLASLLTGCWFIYKPDIKQGNILTPQKVNAIRPGMTREEVTSLLGTPVLVNAFNDNQLIYVYTIQPGHGNFKAQQVYIYFENGHVTKYTANLHS